MQPLLDSARMRLGLGPRRGRKHFLDRGCQFRGGERLAQVAPSAPSTTPHRGPEMLEHYRMLTCQGKSPPSRTGGFVLSWRLQIWEELNGLERDSRMAAKEQVA